MLFRFGHDMPFTVAVTNLAAVSWCLPAIAAHTVMIWHVAATPLMLIISSPLVRMRNQGALATHVPTSTKMQSITGGH